MDRKDLIRQELWSREFNFLKGIDLAYRRTDVPVSVGFFLRLRRGLHTMPGTALDIGCGKGRVGLHLACAGYRVVAFDFVDSALREFRRKARESRTGSVPRVFRQDMNEPWRVPSRSIDVVFAITVVDNLVEASQRAHFRRELLRILKPGGWLVIEFFPPSDGYYGRLLRTSGNRKRRILKDPINGIFFKLYTRPELLRWLGDSFRPVARKEREFRVIKYRKPYRRRTTILALERKPTSRRTS